MCDHITSLLTDEFKEKWRCFDFSGSYWKTWNEEKLHYLDEFWLDIQRMFKDKKEYDLDISFTCWADESNEGSPDILMVYIHAYKIRFRRPSGWVDEVGLPF